MTNRIKAILTALLVIAAVSAMCAAEGNITVPEHLNGSDYVVTLPGGVYAMSTIPIWDWREEGGVTPVKSQSACGSCYAFSAVGMVESAIMVLDSIEYDLSEEQAKECRYESAGADVCEDGGYTTEIVNIYTRNGMVLEADASYNCYPTSCDPIWTPTLRMTDWKFISTTRASTEVLKYYIYSHGPVSACMTGSCLYDYICGDVITEPGYAATHAVVIVGWNDTMEHALGQGAWIVKNSWGDWRHDEGYFYVAYNRAGLGSHSSVMSGYEDYDPTTRTAAHDEAGWTRGMGFHDENYVYQTDAWSLSKFHTVAGEEVTNIEFWTTGAADVDLYVYESFDGITPSDLLCSIEGISYNEPGYHSVIVSPSIIVNDSVVIVAYVNNTDITHIYEYCAPIAIDKDGPCNLGMTYVSPNGTTGSWTYPVFGNYTWDVALRIRLLQTPCERYDTNGESGIQDDEVLDAIGDYYSGLISLETMNVVIACQQGPCEAYDTNGTPGIQMDEVLDAIGDYYDGLIDVDTMNAVIACYNA